MEATELGNLSQDEARKRGIRQGGYSLLNLRADCADVGDDGGALDHNVLDRRYATSVPMTSYPGFASIYPGEPRTYGVDLSAKF